MNRYLSGEGEMETSSGFLSCLPDHLQGIEAKKNIYFDLLRKHKLVTGSLQFAMSLQDARRSKWIQMAIDELDRGEPEAAVLRKFPKCLIKHEP
jgi:hypothetical protein